MGWRFLKINSYITPLIKKASAPLPGEAKERTLKFNPIAALDIETITFEG